MVGHGARSEHPLHFRFSTWFTISSFRVYTVFLLEGVWVQSLGSAKRSPRNHSHHTARAGGTEERMVFFFRDLIKLLLVSSFVYKW